MSESPTHANLSSNAQFDVEGDSSNKQSPDESFAGKYGFIKAGMYAGQFVKINSENKKCKRFNMMLVEENGTFMRKKSGSVIHTALARASFEPLEVNGDSTFDLKDALLRSGFTDLIVQRANLLSQDVQLQTYPPKVNSRLSSLGTGSNSRTSRNRNRGTSSKAKSSSENRVSTNALEESRNNLYWVMEEIPPAIIPAIENSSSTDPSAKVPRRGFPCLWYGGGEEVTATTTITVQRLSLPVSYLLEGSSTEGHWREDEQVINIERGKLLPLDEDLVERIVNATHRPAIANYLTALLLFSDWADSNRDSFVWPQFVYDIFTSDEEVVAFCDRASEHPLNRTEIGRSEQCCVFLFLLAAQHIGVLDQLDLKEYEASGECSGDLTQLMKEICLLREGDPAVRSCSRVAAEYQASLPSEAGGGESQSGDGDSGRISCDSSLRAFAPPLDCSEKNAADEATYLGRVQLLRERHLVLGQLVEAPLVLEEFVVLLTTLWTKKGCLLSGDEVQDRLQLMACWTELVMSSRVAGKKLTGICCVRQNGAPQLVTRIGDLTSITPVADVLWRVDLEVVAPKGVEKPDLLVSRASCLQCCRLFSVPDDEALEVLYAHHGDERLALEAVEVLLSRSTTPRVFPSESKFTNVQIPTEPLEGSNPNILVLQEVELRWYFFATKKYYGNMRKLWRKYNKLCWKHNLDEEALKTTSGAVSTIQSNNVSDEATMLSSSADTPTNETLPPQSSLPKGTYYSMKLRETLRLFPLFFPADDESPFAAIIAAAAPLSVAFSARQHQPLQWNQFAVGSTASVLPSQQALHRAVQPKLFVMKRSSSDPDLDSRRDPSIPHRWPSSLPLMSHNLYWLKTSNSPCMCVGLDPVTLRSGNSEGSLSVITICCATYHHAVSVQASKLEPLDEEIVKQCSDERAAGFALAMMDFADWELRTLPVDSPLRRWYVFPSFIRKFLHHMPTFAAWRKQAERAGRDFKSDRRKMYFSGLVETFNSNRVEEDRDARLSMVNFPWDDSESLGVLKEEEEGPSSRGAALQSVDSVSTDSNSVPVAKPRPPKRKVVGDAAESGSGPGSASKQPKSASSEFDGLSLVGRPAFAPSLFNLYWVSKASLPCLYYDSIENRFNDKVLVLPVCCSTYHYPVEATQSYLEPLTAERIKQCTDERTQDFTLALLDFARWESKFISGRGDITQEGVSDGGCEGPAAKDTGPTDGAGFYLWPDFILDLLNKPKEWAAWRKRVERLAAGKQGIRSQFYFEALQVDYQESLAADSSQESSSKGADSLDGTGMV